MGTSDIPESDWFLLLPWRAVELRSCSAFAAMSRRSCLLSDIVVVDGNMLCRLSEIVAWYIFHGVRIQCSSMCVINQTTLNCIRSLMLRNGIYCTVYLVMDLAVVYDVSFLRVRLFLSNVMMMVF